MLTFTDNKDRTWDLTLSVGAAKRVRARCGVNLFASNLQAIIDEVMGDYVLMVDVIFLIVEPEAKARDVSDEEFGRSLGGDSIEHAAKALSEAITNFTPNPRDRKRVGTVFETAWKAAEIFRDQADEAVNRGTTELLESLRTSAPSTSSPESSESIPTA